MAKATQERDAGGKFLAAPTDPTVHISKAPAKPSGATINSVPSGATGLKRTGGYIFEEFLKELQGRNAARIYQEMTDNDPVIGAMFFSIEMFLRKVKWFVDPAVPETSVDGSVAPTTDTSAADNAKFLRECQDDMSHTWSDFISEALSMLPHGWSYHEILYKSRTTEKEELDDEPPSKHNDKKIGWRKFEIRSQDSLQRWDFDEDDGGLRGMYQIPAPNYQELYVPIKKSLLFRTKITKNNPEGRSILRNAYRPWYFKKRTEEIEGIGVERDLAGLPFAEVPAEMMSLNASDEDKATLASIVQLVKNVRRDEQEGVVWPQSWDEKGTPQYTFKLLNAGGSRQFSTDAIITRYEQRMAMCALADFILLGNDSSGSFALATSKTGMFQAALGAWLDVIQDVLNNYAVPRLFRLNGIEAPYPKFRHDSIQKPALADLSVLVAALAGAGAQLFPDAELENWFKTLAGMPVREIKEGDKSQEDKLRGQKVEADIQGAGAAIEAAKNPPQVLPPGSNGPLGKQPNTKPGAPTKTTGMVKSKLPPASRRNTKAVTASQNVVKREGLEEILKRGFHIDEVRDWHGRWGRGGRSKTPHVDAPKSTPKASPKPKIIPRSKVVPKSVPKVAPSTRAVRTAKGVGQPVDMQTVLDMTGGSAEHHLIRGKDGIFRFSPERAALHDKIVNDILGGHKSQEHPKYNIMGGGPAAGKSTMEAAVPEISNGAALVNADDIKLLLPEYAQKGDAAASFTHEESSYITKRILAEGFAKKINITLDGTGDSSIKALLGKIKAARDKGYEVNGYYVTIDTQTAVDRAMARAAQTGRMVPESIIRTTHKNVSLVLPEAMNAFDSLQLFDNANGIKKVLEKKPGGQAVILDKALWKQFIEKGL